MVALDEKNSATVPVISNHFSGLACSVQPRQLRHSLPDNMTAGRTNRRVFTKNTSAKSRPIETGFVGALASPVNTHELISPRNLHRKRGLVKKKD